MGSRVQNTITLFRPKRHPSSADSHDYVYDFSDHIRAKHGELNEGLETAHRIRLPIPDIRFEQTYLSRVQTCLHVEEIAGKGGGVDSPLSTDDSLTAATHVSPIITSSQQITRIDWGKLAWVTVRDQVIMPLLQGMLWGVVGTYYHPFVDIMKSSLRGKPAPPLPVEGEGVGLLRSWAKKLGLGQLTIGPAGTTSRL
ncbi:uncharacterized protein BJ212DRAFT_1444586 [Suillus subaureus]|uniref:Uncharacterized protein n=1 Tax=Suillus subaureus TaxID=48587 RepID=A0A9P7EJJ7_9AGAM|nr:uncharacterized protein BJ212DRAFT_1444586 [Suillus subaureus]KAG1823431.1 hypothetical protein BJ212DRAFT_1444586 [Suillus subaureus]